MQPKSTWNRLVQELVSEVQKLNGKPAEGTRITGKFFRVWMDVKAAFTGKDRKAILNSCDFGEQQAIDTYDDILENESEQISVSVRAMILAQKTILLADHNRVKALRDALVKA